MTVTINPKFQSLIPPLAPEELAQWGSECVFVPANVVYDAMRRASIGQLRTANQAVLLTWQSHNQPTNPKRNNHYEKRRCVSEQIPEGGGAGG
jgi:hypothetical protein